MKDMSIQQDWNVCKVAGKRQYASKAKAHVYLGRIAKKNKAKGQGTNVHVYHCPDCGFWHIGHTSQVKPVPAKKATKMAAKRVLCATERAINHVARLWMLGEMKRLCAANDEGPGDEPAAA